MNCGARAGRAGTIVAVLLVVPSLFAQAQPAPKQETAKQELPKYEVAGFREARFGMTEPDVRAVVAKSLAVKPADLKTTSNPTEGTTLLTARADQLDPGPGPATITYIFGNKSKRLIQVNVTWGEDAPSTPTDSNAILGAGTRLERYFQGFSWRKDTTRVGIPLGENTVVLFAGEDEKKGAVRLVVDGIKYQMNREGNQTTSPDPKTPPKLIINYIAERENPDVAKIEPGKF
jgi:hypothetical protein